MFSTALGREMRYTVVLPKDCKKREMHEEPFLLFLHGRGRDDRSLVDDPAARATLLCTDRIILFPQGDKSWWVDSPLRANDRYALWLEEVLKDASEHFHLSQRAEDAALCGWSMGGYGAARLLEACPDRFDTIVLLIALLDYPRNPQEFPPGQSYPVHPTELGTDESRWPDLNPMNRIENFRNKHIRLVTGADAFDRTMNERFSKKLTELFIPHEFVIVPGTHSFELVIDQLDDVLLFVREH
ncbi:MAG: alpha/beta hydrolase-fold protein [Planctomycetia bacterium]|nr:alpha/beta hydrolase-fold protein [Planctomycetia bacterium]